MANSISISVKELEGNSIFRDRARGYLQSLDVLLILLSKLWRYPAVIMFLQRARIFLQRARKSAHF